MRANHRITDWNPEDAAAWDAGNNKARAMSGSLIGLRAAVGALGGVGINLALRESYLRSGTETSAYWLFLASYLVAALLTWIMYVRRPFSAPDVPQTKTERELARV